MSLFGKKQQSSTQSFVPIKNIVDGVVILNDNSLRAVLLASSLNFALKSADEQLSTLFQFQNFLNSLDFTVQILIQSRNHNILPYLSLLDEAYQKQSNELLRIQTREYIQFIKTFTENTQIMTKSFYLIVPYTPALIDQSGNPLSRILPQKNISTGTEAFDYVHFEEHKNQLLQRVSVVEEGLSRTGIRVIQLGSEELTELYYKTFNPGDVQIPKSALKEAV